MDTRNRRIVEAFKAGQTMREIGEAYGLTRGRIGQILKRLEVDRADGGVSLRKSQRTDQIIAVMDETGCGATEAARRLGIRLTNEAQVYAAETRHERAVTRFWSRVDKSGGPDACWPWTGGRGNQYGKAGGVIPGEQFAHRVAFILTNGRKPEAAQLFRGAACVLHSCDNPPCCNPAHLREGTMADNMRDRDERGRDRFSRGYGPARPAGFRHSDEARAKMRRAHRRNAKNGRGTAGWWNSLTPEQREAHKKKTADAARAAIAANPAAQARKIAEGKKRAADRRANN